MGRALQAVATAVFAAGIGVGLVASPAAVAEGTAPAVANAAAAAPLVAREPYARAHVLLMARAQPRGAEAKMADVEVWADGTRLRALLHGDSPAQLWVDGLTSDPVVVVEGKPLSPRRKSLQGGLALALRGSPGLSNSKNDRVAGHPCKVMTEELPRGVTMTRCLWRGLPLSVEIRGRGFSFNAAATLVEEDAVSVADLQPPPGAPAAPASLSATR